MAVARYDGYADWYDDWRKPHAASTAHEVADLLGPGEGLCLDLGCGTGLFLDALAATGRAVVGLDRSADQLRIACGRSRRILQADAAALPFRDLTFTAVAALWISTDVDDFASVLTEAARVLTPGGVFLFYGAHPCFNGPHRVAGRRRYPGAPDLPDAGMAQGGAVVGRLRPQAGWDEPPLPG